MKALRPDETIRNLSIYALGVVLANAVVAAGLLVNAAMQGHWQLLLLHGGKCLLISGWTAYRWLSLVRRRYVITRPWQAGRPQQIKTALQRLAILAAVIWLFAALWHVSQNGFYLAGLLRPELFCLPLTTLVCFIAIDIVNYIFIEKIVQDAGEGDVSRYTY